MRRESQGRAFVRARPAENSDIGIFRFAERTLGLKSGHTHFANLLWASDYLGHVHSRRSLFVLSNQTIAGHSHNSQRRSRARCQGQQYNSACACTSRFLATRQPRPLVRKFPPPNDNQALSKSHNVQAGEGEGDPLRLPLPSSVHDIVCYKRP